MSQKLQSSSTISNTKHVRSNPAERTQIMHASNKCEHKMPMTNEMTSLGHVVAKEVGITLSDANALLAKMFKQEVACQLVMLKVATLQEKVEAELHRYNKLGIQRKLTASENKHIKIFQGVMCTLREIVKLYKKIGF